MDFTIRFLAAVLCALAVPHSLDAADPKQLAEDVLAMLGETRAPWDDEAPKPPPDNATLDRLHKEHREALRKILTDHGWPIAREVGVEAESAMFTLLEEEYRDADLLKQAQKALYAAVSRHEARKSDLATLIDLTRVSEHQPQIYGTQYLMAADGQLKPYPIDDPAHVESRRALMELSTLQYQEEAIGLRKAKPAEIFAGTAQSFTSGTKIEAARGLNSRSDVLLGTVYVHSRDDPRAKDGEHAAPSGNGL